MEAVSSPNKTTSNGGLRNRVRVMSEAGQLTSFRDGGKEKENGAGQLEKKNGASSHARLVLVCFVGIFVSYFIYGLIQEKMYEAIL